MPWMSHTALRGAVADMMQKKDPSDLGISDGVFAQAMESAKQDLLDALEMKGYTLTEIEAADRLGEYHLNQGIYRYLMNPGVVNPTDKSPDSYDRVKMLSVKNFGLRVGGTIIWPGAGAVKEEAAGTVGYGRTDIPEPDW